MDATWTVYAIAGSVLIGVIAFLAFAVYSNNSAGSQIVREWALNHRYKLIRCHRCFCFTGPFMLGFLGASRRPIFAVTVADDSGAERCGWVRVGGLLLGVNSHKAEVRWAKQA